MTTEPLPAEPAPHPAVAPVIVALEEEIAATEFYLTALKRTRIEAVDLGRSIDALGRPEPDTANRIRELIGDRVLVPTAANGNGHAVAELPPVADDPPPPPALPPRARGRRSASSAERSSTRAPRAPARKTPPREEIEQLVREAMRGEGLLSPNKVTVLLGFSASSAAAEKVRAVMVESVDIVEQGQIRGRPAYVFPPPSGGPSPAAPSSPARGESSNGSSSSPSEETRSLPAVPDPGELDEQLAGASEDVPDPELVSALGAASGEDSDPDPDPPQGISWPQPGETSLSNLRSRLVHLLKVSGAMSIQDMAIAVEYGSQDVADCVRALLRDEDVERTGAGLYAYVGA